MGWFNRKKQENEAVADEGPSLPEFDFSEIRKKSLALCQEAGFSPANSLPWIKEAEMRPAIEIAGRLNAIKAMVLWLLVPAENVPDNVIIRFMSTNELSWFMSEEEKGIFEVARDDEHWRNAIGWKFENAWPLAWYFGYKDVEISGEMMSGDDIQEILINHTCDLEGNLEEWIKTVDTVDSSLVFEKEDAFYCLHNAVRSAQMGGDTVPDGFHSAGNGGVIHERRHALTWMISNGVRWEETDLTT